MCLHSGWKHLKQTLPFFDIELTWKVIFKDSEKQDNLPSPTVFQLL